MSQQCMTCGQNDSRDDDALRVKGWRIWSGQTVTGREAKAVYCAACCGEAGVDEKGDSIGWWAECITCGAVSDDLDEANATQKDVEMWERDHECEPEVKIHAPERQVQPA